MYNFDDLKKFAETLHEGSTSLITVILLIYILPKIFKDFNLISEIKGLHGLKRRKLEEIIKNKKVKKSTRLLAKQELTALFNYRLTGVFNYKIRAHVVEIVSRNHLPARYFKPFRSYLNIENSNISINEKSYNRDKKIHLWGMGIFCSLSWLFISFLWFIALNLETAFFGTIAYAIIFSFFFFLTMPPLRSYVDKVKIYIEEYNENTANSIPPSTDD